MVCGGVQIVKAKPILKRGNPTLGKSGDVWLQVESKASQYSECFAPEKAATWSKAESGG